MSHQMSNPPVGEPQVFGAAYTSPTTLTTDMPDRPRAPLFTRREVVHIATSAARHYFATCSDPFSSEGVGAAVVDALYGLAVLDLDDGGWVCRCSTRTVRCTPARDGRAADAAERDLATSGVMTAGEVLDAVEAWCNHKAVEIGPPSDDVEYRMQAQLLTNLRNHLADLREDL